MNPRTLAATIATIATVATLPMAQAQTTTPRPAEDSRTAPNAESPGGSKGMTNSQPGTGASPSDSQGGTTGAQPTAPTQGAEGSTGRMQSGAGGTQGGPRADQDTVRKVQQALQSEGMQVGRVDGVMGPETEAALRQFQQKNNLEQTGRIDSATLTALKVDSTGSGMSGSGSTGGASSGSSGAGGTSRGTMGSDRPAAPSSGGPSTVDQGSNTGSGTK